MGPPLNLFNPQVAGIVERCLALCLHKRKFVEYRIAVSSPIEQQLCAGIESDQKVLVRIVAGLYELAQRVTSTLNFVAAHRAGHIKDDTD